ncbi:MAG: hypothetical protein EP329_10975 [Deltaproteobacteria bacterium]|nr:MAG: hypothetical protein EP329_10975 [Deltaproteobacteria bacterium]
MTLFERVAAVLAAEELGFEEGPSEGSLVTVIPGVHGNFVVAAVARSADERLIFYAFGEQDTPEERRAEVMELVTRANYAMLIGNFELDLEDGEVRFKVAVDLEGVEDVTSLVRTHMTACMVTFDQYLPALYAVQRGTATVLEALAVVEGGDDEGDDDEL